MVKSTLPDFPMKSSHRTCEPFRFHSKEDVSNGASIEIYHGAHGKFETRSPIRTFAAYEAGGEQSLIAAYTCTPLVRIPISSMQADTKVVGKTVAGTWQSQSSA